MEIVSVIIPCYNQGMYIEECIESIYSQTYEKEKIEVVVVDDGSDDINTIEVLKILSEKYPNIKVVKTENSGVSIARNTGIQKSIGKYIVPLDADDKIGSKFIEYCVNILESKDDIGVIYTETELFGIVEGIFILPKFSEIQMLHGNVVVCTAMYRREAYNKTVGYNPNMIYGYEDWDFWLSMIEIGQKFYKIDENLFFYRRKITSRSTYIIDNVEKHKKMFEQVFYNHEALYGKYNISLDYLLTWNMFV